MLFSATALAIAIFVWGVVSVIWSAIEPESYVIKATPFRRFVGFAIGGVVYAWAATVLFTGWSAVLALVLYFVGLVLAVALVEGVRDAK